MGAKIVSTKKRKKMTTMRLGKREKRVVAYVTWV
jgi:hypothetical protein